LQGLRLDEVHKSFAETRALQGISFEVAPGEILALLGPSGCGKSTTLAIIAGLETPDQGRVYWEGVDLEGTPPHKRGFGLMFQDLALFPHLDVFHNVAFGLRMAGLPEAQVRAQAAQALELVGLPGFERRDVNTLSGGEGQRVALARSLAAQPRLLMLDEPLGALDRNLRERLLAELGEILRRASQTTVYVTHDQEEAFALADRVVVMNAGRVEQAGSPQELYRRPTSPFVARFLGLTNLIEGVIRKQDGAWHIETTIGRLPLKEPPSGRASQGQVTVLLRPETARLDGQQAFQIEGVVMKRTFRGGTCRLEVEVNGVTLDFDFPSRLDLPKEGERVRLGFEPGEALQFLG